MRAPRSRRALGACALVLAACAGAPSEGGDVPPRAPPPPAPAWVPGSGSGAADPVVAVAPPPDQGLFAKLVPPSPLADPHLAPARDLVQRDRRVDAAREVEARAAVVESESGRAAGADAGKAELVRLHLLAATLRRDGGDPDGAARAYDRVASASPVLAPVARIEIAAIRLRQGKAAEALAALEAVAPEDRTSASWLPLHAEAAVRAGDAMAGAAELEAFLSRARRPSGAASTGLRIASALLLKPGADRAEAAARIARKLVGLASGPTAAEAHALEKRALDVLPRARRVAVGGSALADKIESARAKLKARDTRAAVTALDRLVKGEGKSAKGDDACALHRVRGDALGEVKRKAEAADAYGAAIEACASAPDRLDVIFAAAKASARAERAAEAEARYALVESTDPKSRLADDARGARVQAAIDHDDLATATALARSAVATYPNGDLVFDAPFALALAHMAAERWAEALPILEATVGPAARERSYPRAGRFGYFLGRAREARRDRVGAAAAYAEVVRTRAATYYGALAHARLEELEPGAGARAHAAAMQRGNAASFLPDPTADELASGSLRRAIELAIVGDAQGADAEMTGAEGARPPSPGLRWWQARLVALGDPIRASSLLRGTSEVEPSPGEVGFDVWLDNGPFGAPLLAWRVAYPRPFTAEVTAASTESGVGAPLILSIMREESAFSPTALSRTGARGLLQLMPATARKMAKPLGLPHDDEALQRPEVNTRLGARFLGQLRERFPHEPLLAVPSYNAGPLAVEKWCEERPQLDFDLWVETIPYRETRLYTKRVLASLAAYDLLGGARQRGEVFFTPRRACIGRAAASPEDLDVPEPAWPSP